MENQGKINLLIVTSNPLQPKQVHDFVLSDGTRLFRVFPADSMLRVKDYFTRRKFELVIVDESFREDFWAEFSSFNDKSVPVYFLALEAYTDVGEKLDLGYRDVLFKPVDLPILLSKISHDAPNLMSGKFLVSTGCSLKGEISMSANISSIAETGAVFQTSGFIEIGARIILSIPGSVSKSTVAEVISSKEDGDKFSTTVIFRGATNSFIQDMRKLLKTVFISKKLDN